MATEPLLTLHMKQGWRFLRRHRAPQFGSTLTTMGSWIYLSAMNTALVSSSITTATAHLQISPILPELTVSHLRKELQPVILTMMGFRISTSPITEAKTSCIKTVATEPLRMLPNSLAWKCLFSVFQLGSLITTTMAGSTFLSAASSIQFLRCYGPTLVCLSREKL